MNLRLALPLALAAALSGCSSSPPARIYVLSPAAGSATPIAPASQAPGLLIQPVQLPDYLDTTDIITRQGPNELTASRTGQWCERLSTGVSRSLCAALAARLPGMTVTLGPATADSASRVTVNVTALDVWPDGHGVFAATWQIAGSAHEAAVKPEAETSVIAAAGASRTGDAAVVAGVAAAVDQLADRIAAAVRRESPEAGSR